MKNLNFYLLLVIFIMSCNDRRTKGSGQTIYFEKKVDETTINIFPKEAELLIDNFPRYHIGHQGFGKVSWQTSYDFFKRVDNYIFDVLKSDSYLNYSNNGLKIFIKYYNIDHYGKSTPTDWIFIGKIDVEEVRKYENFKYWNNDNGIEKIFWKTEPERVINITVP